MKKMIILFALGSAACFFTACDNPQTPPQKNVQAPPPPPQLQENEVRPGDKKPVGVPTKVFNKVKGIEHQHNDNLDQQLNNM